MVRQATEARLGRLWDLYVKPTRPTEEPLDRRRRIAHRVLLGLGICVAGMAVVSAGIGAIPIAPTQVLSVVLAWLGLPVAHDVPAQHVAVLEVIRLPRIALGLLVGASLAVAGATMQGLFRNPLADPGLMGVSSGAALAAVAVIVLGQTLAPGALVALGSFALPAAAFAGGIGVTTLIYALGRRGGRVVVATMLLAGIAVNALAGAAIGVLTFISTDIQLRTLTFWTMGSLGGSTFGTIWPALLLMAAALVWMLRLARPLNVYLLGEREARHLGIDTDRLKHRAVLGTAMAVGAAVAVSGIIGFVGLVVPHLLRLMLGPDNRWVLPGSALLGAGLLTLADLAARMVLLPAELPIGLVTSIVGGPFFLWLLVRQRGLYA